MRTAVDAAAPFLFDYSERIYGTKVDEGAEYFTVGDLLSAATFGCTFAPRSGSMCRAVPLTPAPGAVRDTRTGSQVRGGP